MFRNAVYFTLVFQFAATILGRIEAQEVDGTWKLVQLQSGGKVEYAWAIVKLKTVNGKITGEVIDNSGGRPYVEQEGDVLRVFPGYSGTVFEAPIPKTPAKRWLGAVITGKQVAPAWLSQTKETKIDVQQERLTHVCPPLQEALALTDKVEALYAYAYGKFGNRPTAGQKKDYLARAAEAEEVAKKETPRLYREVLARFPDDPGVFEAFLGLMRSAEANKATLDEVKRWAAAADNTAKAYGPSFEAWFAAQAAAALVAQKDYAALAVDYARRVERKLTPNTPVQEQIDALAVLGRALRKEAKNAEARIAKLEDALDQKYLASLPAPKEVFEGRKSKSHRAVILERFTGFFGREGDHECDMLLRTYKPSELVLLRYYLPDLNYPDRPVPEPLANSDAQARWAYYTKAFPIELRQPPANVFDGYPEGRLRRGTKGQFKALREIIEPMLEEDAGVTIAAKADRCGDTVAISVNVLGLAKPSAEMKLRIVLMEQTVRYQGRNGVRLHNHVVRACPGGVAGTSLTDAASKHNFTINIDKLRGQLTKYFEESHLATRTLGVPAPPLALEHLRVIAFVQDDDTRKILQAVQVEVK